MNRLFCFSRNQQSLFILLILFFEVFGFKTESFCEDLPPKTDLLFYETYIISKEANKIDDAIDSLRTKSGLVPKKIQFGRVTQRGWHLYSASSMGAPAIPPGQHPAGIISDTNNQLINYLPKMSDSVTLKLKEADTLRNQIIKLRAFPSIPFDLPQDFKYRFFNWTDFATSGPLIAVWYDDLGESGIGFSYIDLAPFGNTPLLSNHTGSNDRGLLSSVPLNSAGSMEDNIAGLLDQAIKKLQSELELAKKDREQLESKITAQKNAPWVGTFESSDHVVSITPDHEYLSRYGFHYRCKGSALKWTGCFDGLQDTAGFSESSSTEHYQYICVHNPNSSPKEEGNLKIFRHALRDLEIKLGTNGNVRILELKRNE